MSDKAKTRMPKTAISLGISSCLLGEQVRYDGGHKRDGYVVNILSQFFSFRPICPEVGIGMSVPRPPIRLTGEIGAVRVRGIKDTELDVTEQLAEFARVKAKQLDTISGYIFKKDSPSCGMERVKRYASEQGMPVRDGVGEYARVLMQALPLLPCEEEGRLHDPILRENFIERVFVYARWQELLQNEASITSLTQFHAQHKYALMAHDQNALRALGQIAANAKDLPIDTVLEQYGNLLMQTFSQRATRKNHVNVLQHIQGYLKRDLDAGDKQELSDTIEQYRQGLLPLVVPITLLKHFFRKYEHDYIRSQTYINPHPPELMLRNQI